MKNTFYFTLKARFAFKIIKFLSWILGYVEKTAWYKVQHIWRHKLGKGCAHDVFPSLFCISEKEHFWNKKKWFLFHFESSFRSWDNQVFNFSNIQFSWRHQVPKHEIRNTFHWVTWEVNKVWWWDLAKLCNITRDFFIKKLPKTTA